MNLWDIPVIDHHAHNLLKPELVQASPYTRAFTEGYAPEIVEHHARHTLFYRRSLRDLGQLLDCEPTETAIVQCRQQLGLEQLTQLCFQAANLEAIYLDDGFLAADVLPWQWHEQFVSVKRVLRLEYLAENLLAEENQFDSFVERFRHEIESPSAEVVALKSIAAYRTGLDIQFHPLDEVKANFATLKQQGQTKPLRLSNKPLIDFLITQALAIAAKSKLPLQFHTGFGDPDLDLRLANPLYLRRLFEHKDFRQAPIVLLHAAYPYAREAGYLASVYPQVYLDFGLAVPFLSVAGMRSCLRQLLELTPTTKLMYSSDAHNISELYYLGAKWGREILDSVLIEAIQERDLTTAEAETVAQAILLDNARSLYNSDLHLD